MALTLLIVSGLMIRTFIAMRQVDPGFVRPEEVQTFVVAIPPPFIEDDEQAARTFENIARHVAQVPGVTSVGLSSSITMDGENNGNAIEVEGADPARRPLRRFKSFAPGYFETMGSSETRLTHRPDRRLASRRLTTAAELSVTPAASTP